THTTPPVHREVVQDFFLALHKKGFIYKDTTIAPYCPVDKRFLPDRYVEGECPHCGYKNARGDQCDNCGRPLDPIDLINPRCRLCGTTPEFRSSEHFFLDLPKLEKPLLEWLEKDKEHWRPNVTAFTLNWIKEGLKARAYTRESGDKASTSRGGGGVPWLPDYLDRYQPDPIRYFMTANAPETRDSAFSWAEFYRRNNDELVATYGNLVHRVLTFTARNFEGKVPEPGEFTEQDRAMLESARGAFERVGAQ